MTHVLPVYLELFDLSNYSMTQVPKCMIQTLLAGTRAMYASGFVAQLVELFTDGIKFENPFGCTFSTM